MDAESDVLQVRKGDRGREGEGEGERGRGSSLCRGRVGVNTFVNTEREGEGEGEGEREIVVLWLCVCVWKEEVGRVHIKRFLSFLLCIFVFLCSPSLLLFYFSLFSFPFFSVFVL